MNPNLLLSLLSILCFFAFLILLIISIFKKSKKTGVFALLPLVIFVGLAVVIAFKIYRKGKQFVTDISTARTGIEVYTDWFGKPQTNCVSIPHFFDPVIPVIDAELWLDIQTCPAEVARMIKANNFVESDGQSDFSYDFLDKITSDSLYKEWATEMYMKRWAKVYRYKDMDTNEQFPTTLLVSKDSTHAFLLDISN